PVRHGAHPGRRATPHGDDTVVHVRERVVLAIARVGEGDDLWRPGGTGAWQPVDVSDLTRAEPFWWGAIEAMADGSADGLGVRSIVDPDGGYVTLTCIPFIADD